MIAVMIKIVTFIIIIITLIIKVKFFFNQIILHLHKDRIFTAAKYLYKLMLSLQDLNDPF